MRRWIVLALSFQALLLVALTAVLYFVPIQLEWVAPSGSTVARVAIADPPGEAAGDFELMSADDWQQFEQRWAQAPEVVRALARQIAEGEWLNPMQLQELGAEALSRGYPAPELDFTRDGTPVPWRSTLLQEAVWAYNLKATQTLLEAGADPNAHHGEVLFIAIEQRTRGAPHLMLFPDHDEMIPFLRAYLDAGANPNVQRYGFLSRTPFDFADGQHNLAALLLLLEFGADPWFEIPDTNGFSAGSTMELLAFGAGAAPSTETLFRVARSGHLSNGPEEIEKKVFMELSDVAYQFASGTGSDSRHTAWRLDQLLQVLGLALNREEEANKIRQKLAPFDYQADGGWHLAQHEVHSRHDAPLSVPDRGSEIWGP